MWRIVGSVFWFNILVLLDVFVVLQEKKTSVHYGVWLWLGQWTHFQHVKKSIGCLSKFTDRTDILWHVTMLLTCHQHFQLSFSPLTKDCLFYVILGSPQLLHLEVAHWLILDTTGPVTFIEATQLCNFPQFCNGNFITFSSRSSSIWELQIINPLHGTPPVVKLIHHQWTGTVTMKLWMTGRHSSSFHKTIF